VLVSRPVARLKPWEIVEDMLTAIGDDRSVLEQVAALLGTSPDNLRYALAPETRDSDFDTPEELLTPREAAAELGVTLSGIRYYRSRGYLPTRRNKTNKVRIPLSAVLKLKAERETFETVDDPSWPRSRDKGTRRSVR
jgi:helix-turn-helix protein